MMDDEEQPTGILAAIEPDHPDDRPLFQVQTALRSLSVMFDERRMTRWSFHAQVDHLQRHSRFDRAIPVMPTFPVLAVAQPERIVVFDGPADRLFEHRTIERRHLQQYRLVRMMRFGRRLLEEPPLNRDEGDVPFERALD